MFWSGRPGAAGVGAVVRSRFGREGVLGFWERFEDRAAGRWPDGPGGRVLASLYHGGLVDPAHALVHPSGFEWWASGHVQRVALAGEQTLEGLRISRLLIETEVSLSPAGAVAAELPPRLDALNRHASLSALVSDEDGRLVLAASLVVHEKNLSWAQRLLGPLLALQAVEAPAVAAALSELAAPARSAHPERGPRERSQAALGDFASRVLARDAAPPLDPRIFEDIAATLRDVGLVARADAKGLDVEMPFAGESALLQLLGPMEHPALGSGVLCVLVLPVLSLPHALSAAGPAALLARLNAQARVLPSRAESLPALGGWAPDPNSGHPALAVFLPAALAGDEMLTDLAMAQLARALLLARCFGDASRDEAAFGVALSEAI